jgi:MOSC domain-containing protein YiiM
MSGEGRVVALQVCPGRRLPMRPVDPAVFVRDRGLDGDAHARPGSRRQVLLIDLETLEALGLAPGAVKENVTVRGLPLGELGPGTRLALGSEVVVWVTGPCSPCGRMDEIRPGLQQDLRGRRGVLAWVERGGAVRVGDPVRVLSRPPAD